MSPKNKTEFVESPPSTVPDSKETLRTKWEEAKKEFTELGGWQGLKSGAWLLPLIRKSFRNYWERANSDYFKSKYKSKDIHYIIKRLTSVTARNAAILGSITGAAISVDELVALATAGEFGVGLTANIAIALAAIGGETILLVRLQLQLIANIAKLYNVPLNPDDPEDILIILGYALGGSFAEEAGKLAAKVGAGGAKALTKKFISKEVLEFLKQLGKKVGIKILQKTIVRYAVPIVSIGVGAGWNYLSIKSIGQIACIHFKKRCEENRQGRGHELGKDLGTQDSSSGRTKRTPLEVDVAAKQIAPAFGPSSNDEFIIGFRKGYAEV